MNFATLMITFAINGINISICECGALDQTTTHVIDSGKPITPYPQKIS